MPEMSFAEAIDDALGQAMAIDPRIVVLGVDVPMLRRNLYVRFGKDRVRASPISEGALVGAAVTASMELLRSQLQRFDEEQDTTYKRIRRAMERTCCLASLVWRWLR